jgi:hypothetical protein
MSLRFLADVNFDRNIIRGIHRTRPDIDIIRAQDAGHHRTPDPLLLEWCFQEHRIMLTHDVKTMPGFAYARIADGHHVAGLVEVDDQASIGRVIEDLLTLIDCLDEDEWQDRIWFVPL